MSKASAQCAFNDPNGSCGFTPPMAAHKFRNGYYAKAHGITFAHPRRVRSVFVHKIVVQLNRHPKQAALVRQHYGLAKSSCDSYCVAYGAWGDIIHRVNCISNATSSTAKSACNAHPESDAGFLGDITRKGIMRTGTVVLCSGSVVIGTAAAVGSDGLASPAVVATWGGLGCGWGFMESFF